MWKEKLHFLGNYIIKHSKVVLPAVVVVAVAVTVSVSLSMNNRHREEQQNAESAAAVASEIATEPTTEDVPLVANEEGAVYTLVATYYNAMAVMRQRYVPFVMRSPTKTCIVIWNWHSILIIIRLWRSIPRPARKRVR